jgi:replicative DNA helicase
MAPSTTTLGQQLSSLEAEQATLGGILIDPDRLIDVLPLLSPSDFSHRTYRAVYDVIRRLADQRRPIDIVTVASELTTNTAFQMDGGSALLAQLCANTPTAANVVRYAQIVKDRALHRTLANIGQSLVNLAADESVNAGDIIERAEQQILSIARHATESRPQHIASVAAEGYERYVALHAAEDKVGLFGLRTGFRKLDEMLTGLVPGQLVILAARPSMGKTALALDIARYVASEQQKNVAIFSLEMTKQEIMDRVIAGLLGVETWRLKKGQLSEDDFARMGKLFDSLKQHPIYIDDDPDTTIGHLRSKARRQQMEEGLDLLIIDYLQLIEVTDRASGENRTQQVSHISRSLKNLSRELGCPILALSQLSRSVEQRSPAIPILSDLRESGSIEQDADIVLMMYREDAYHDEVEEPGLTELYVRKNRSGPTGRVELRFAKERMSFIEK